MITLSRYNQLETLWDELKENSIIPDEVKAATEQNLLGNKLMVNVNFCNHRMGEEELQNRLAEYYGTIALVDPLVKDASARLGQEVKLIVTDPNGTIISCQQEDVIGYCCPAAELVNSDHQLRDKVGMGSIVEVHYDNGICSQLVPIFNEHGDIVFYWGVSDYNQITPEVSMILYLAAQLLQQRYKYVLMINEYTSSFLNAIPECVVILDENGRIIDMNQICMNFLRIDDKNKFIGMHIGKLISIESLHEILTSDQKIQFPIRIWEEEIPCQVICKQPITGPYGNQLLILFNKVSANARFSALSSFKMLPEVSDAFDKIIGNTPEMNKLKTLAQRAAKSTATVLIEGESGTGKELFAEAIHQASQRTGRFVAINCGGIPSELIQSELFGYDEGAFTGAKRSGSPGKFEVADGGTVFLDEIGEMPLDMQVSLLRFLQDKAVTRVGGCSPKKVDVRIIAATNRDLKDEVEKGNFREDLYYRLNVIKLQIPPLRKRKEDIPLIADYLLKKFCNQEGIEDIEINERALQALIHYPWPGNARELENTVERAFILRQDKELAFDYEMLLCAEEGNCKLEIESNIYQIQKEAIEDYLQIYKGNVSKTANVMGITRQTLYRKMKSLNIDHRAFI